MSIEFKESKYGSIIPRSFDLQLCKFKSEFGHIVCSLKSGIIIEGFMKIFGIEDTDIEVYVIEMKKKFPFCIDSRHNDFKQFKSNMEFILFVKNTANIIKIDDFGFVQNIKEIRERKEIKYKEFDFVLVQLDDQFKVAKILESGIILGVPCHKIQLSSENDDKVCIVLDKNVIGKFLDENGHVSDLLENIKLEPDEKIVNVNIGERIKYSTYNGFLRWKGRVNGLECVGIEDNSKHLSDFSYHCNARNSYWTMIPFNREELITLRQNSVDRRENSFKETSQITNDVPPEIMKPNKPPIVDRDREGRETNYRHPDIELGEPLAIMRDVKDAMIDTDDSIRSIYAIVHSMFIFTELFDSLLIERKSGCKKEFLDYLVSNIVSPIRRCDTVERRNWKELLKLFGQDFNVEKFLEVIDFKFKIFDIDHEEIIERKIIDISHFVCENPKLKMNELLNLYCLEKKYWLLKPPKCLIIMKGENNVPNIPILSKLDITKLTVNCVNKCSVCSSDANLICFDCSNDKKDVTYFCKDHKTHCKHLVKKSVESWGKSKCKGDVELELSSIVCKNASEYHAYVKTMDVKGNWLRFSINKNGKCTVTEIDLQTYFTAKSNWNKKSDIDNLENHMVFCIYKYPPLEFYWNGF